jgi:hypothetical protein
MYRRYETKRNGDRVYATGRAGEKWRKNKTFLVHRLSLRTDDEHRAIKKLRKIQYLRRKNYDKHQH